MCKTGLFDTAQLGIPIQIVSRICLPGTDLSD